MNHQQDLIADAEIVVADDTLANLHSLNELLKHEGYRIRPCNVRELFNELRRWNATGEVELSDEAQEAFEAFYLRRAMEHIAAGPPNHLRQVEEV